MDKLRNPGASRNAADKDRVEVAGVSGAKAIIPAIAGFGAGTVAAILSGGAAIPTLGGSVAVGTVAVPAAAITASLATAYLQEKVLNYFAPKWNAEQNKQAQDYPVTAFVASALTGTGVNSVLSKVPVAQVVSGTIAQRVASGVTEAGVGAGVNLALNGGKFSDDAGFNAIMDFALGVATPNRPRSLRPGSRRIPPGSAPEFFPPETIADLENFLKPSNRFTILDNEGRQVANPNYDPGKPQTQKNLNRDRAHEAAVKEYERVQNKAKNDAEIRAHQKAQVKKFEQDRRTIQAQIDNKDFPAAAKNIQELNSNIQRDNETFNSSHRYQLYPPDRIPLRDPTAESVYQELLNDAGFTGIVTRADVDAKIQSKKLLNTQDPVNPLSNDFAPSSEEALRAREYNHQLNNARHILIQNVSTPEQLANDKRYTKSEQRRLEKLTTRLEKMPRTQNQENMDANRVTSDYILGKFRDTWEGVKGGVKQGWNDLFPFDPKAQVNSKDPLKNQETLEEAAAIIADIKKKGPKNPPAANKPAEAEVKKQPETEDDKKTRAFLESLENGSLLSEPQLSEPASTTATKPRERYEIVDDDFTSKPKGDPRYREAKKFLESLGPYNYLKKIKDNPELAAKLGKLRKDLYEGTETKAGAIDILQKEYDNDPGIVLERNQAADARKQKEDAAANDIVLDNKALEIKDRVDKKYRKQIKDAMKAKDYKEVARLEMESSLAFHGNLNKEGVPLNLPDLNLVSPRSARTLSEMESSHSNFIYADLKRSRPDLFGDKVEITGEILKAQEKAIRDEVYTEHRNMRDDSDEVSSLTLSEPQSILDRVYLNLMQYFGIASNKSKEISNEIIQKRAQYIENKDKAKPPNIFDDETFQLPAETDADRSNRERTDSSPGSNSDDSNQDTLSRLMKRGAIYASAGRLINFEPKGTDTVPAMLTPGEFVVNRAATQANLPLLQSINKARGGLIYAENGGQMMAEDSGKYGQYSSHGIPHHLKDSFSSKPGWDKLSDEDKHTVLLDARDKDPNFNKKNESQNENYFMGIARRDQFKSGSVYSRAKEVADIDGADYRKYSEKKNRFRESILEKQKQDSKDRLIAEALGMPIGEYKLKMAIGDKPFPVRPDKTITDDGRASLYDFIAGWYDKIPGGIDTAISESQKSQERNNKNTLLDRDIWPDVSPEAIKRQNRVIMNSPEIEGSTLGLFNNENMTAHFGKSVDPNIADHEFTHGATLGSISYRDRELLGLPRRYTAGFDPNKAWDPMIGDKRAHEIKEGRDTRFPEQKAKYSLEPSEVDARIVDIKRRFAFYTGKLVTNAEEAKEAWDWWEKFDDVLDIYNSTESPIIDFEDIKTYNSLDKEHKDQIFNRKSELVQMYKAAVTHAQKG